MQRNLARIIIADDDPEDLELIEQAILVEKPSAELHTFTNGYSAYEYLRTRQDNELPCLIILDYNMPRLNGAEVLSNLNNEARYKAIPKIVLSTSNAPHHKHECMISGATGYYTKPANLNDLNSLAKKLVTLCSA